ncbi:ATP-binding protein [Paraliobacillus sediminis]|uniref:ATP-binding protein n=1 Tax=Paraliobacillus sediminis TaxID=1885916 RepID=UPI000E3BF5BA|nr:AAA family ATPase [Paraliobacillus sediminis]
MKIIEANIFGFGKWKQTTIDLSGASFIVIAGQNESGKSTLRQFMLFILFGMPPKQRAQFLPKTGGEMGGTLTIQTQDGGAFTIERIHDRNKAQATCYDQDGIAHGEAWLRERLNGVDAQTFADIFSFDSISLQRLQQIKQTDIGEVLLGVGMTGTDQIYWTEKWLDQQLQDLFRPQGKKPVINQLIDAMEEKAKQLEQMEQEARSYQEKQQTKASLAEAVGILQEKSEQLHKEKQQTEQKQQVYEVIEAFHHTQNKLSELPSEISFPENGLERYQQLKEQMLPLKSELTVVRMNIDKEAKQLEEIKSKQLTPATMDELEKMKEQRYAYHESINKHSFNIQTKEEWLRQLTHEMEQLQIGLTIEQVADLSLPFATEDIWQQLKEEHEDVMTGLAKTENELKEIEEQSRFLEQEREMLENKQIDQVTIDELNQQLDNDQKSASLNQQQNNNWKVLRKKRLASANRVSVYSLILLIISGVVGFLLSNTYLYDLSAVILVIALLHQVVTRQSIRSMEPLFVTQNQVDRTNTSSRDKIMEIETVIAEQANLTERLTKINESLRNLQLENLKADERRQFFKQKQSILGSKRMEQLEQFPFLKEISLSYWPKLFNHLTKVVEKVEKLGKLEQDILLVRKDIDQYEQGLAEAFLSINQLQSRQPTEMLEIIIDEADNQKHLKQKEQQLNNNQANLIGQQETIESRLKPYQEELDQLWNKASVHNEESYITKGNIKEEQLEKRRELKAYEHQIRMFLSEHEWERLLAGEQIQKYEIENALFKVTSQLKDVQDQIKIKQQEVADMHAEIRQVELSTSFQDEKHHYYRLKNELQEQTKQWAIYQLAKEKLQETKNMYQRSFLPKVLEQTTKHFKDLTNQKYRDVFLTDQEAMLQVENDVGIRFIVTELSQGTRDQLYIALRIALSEIIQKQYQMPFFIDDAFVHFDLERLDKMYVIFKQLATKQQIIIFTNDTSWSETVTEKDDLRLIRI